MFCPNCGNNCGDFSFCPNCGTKLKDPCQPSAPIADDDKSQTCQYPPLKEPYVQEIAGKKVDLNKVIRAYGTRKVGAYAYLAREFGISKAQAKQILDPLYEAHAGEKVSFMSGFAAEAGLRADKKALEASRRKELDASGQVYCPKCLSTSVSANQKGFSFGKGAIGMAAGLDVGLIAGGIGSKKVICTCLKCGYQWKAGKK